jgi:hypothetical protein
LNLTGAVLIAINNSCRVVFWQSPSASIQYDQSWKIDRERIENYNRDDYDYNRRSPRTFRGDETYEGSYNAELDRGRESALAEEAGILTEIADRGKAGYTEMTIYPWPIRSGEVWLWRETGRKG